MTRPLHIFLAALTLAALAACETTHAGPMPGPESRSLSMQVDLAEWSVRSRGLSGAGNIEFNVRNLSGTHAHELVVLQTSLSPDRLIMQTGISQVDEDASGRVAGYVGGTSLPAGGRASSQFHLAQGNYVLLCNIPGHYEAGMYAELTVH